MERRNKMGSITSIKGYSYNQVWPPTKIVPKVLLRLLKIKRLFNESWR